MCLLFNCGCSTLSVNIMIGISSEYDDHVEMYEENQQYHKKYDIILNKMPNNRIQLINNKIKENNMDFRSKVANFKLLDNIEARNVEGLSHYKGYVIDTTYTELYTIFGEPTYTNQDNVNNEWVFSCSYPDEDNFYFSIYDWNYRDGYDKNEKITWNIGTSNYWNTVLIIDVLKEHNINAQISY